MDTDAGQRPVPARIRRAAGALCILATGALVLACARSPLGDDPATGFDLAVTRGPITPVAREGEPNSEPVPGARIAVRAADGAEARTTTDAAGQAALDLRPGAYLVEVERCPGALLLPAPRQATVVAGRRTSLALECDTGIR